MAVVTSVASARDAGLVPGERTRGACWCRLYSPIWLPRAAPHKSRPIKQGIRPHSHEVASCRMPGHREESPLSVTGGGAVVPGGWVVDHAEVQSVDPVPHVHGQHQLPAEVVAEEADVGGGEVHPRNHEGTTDGRQDGAPKQALERVAECGRSPPQERVDRDYEHDGEDN